MIYKAITRRETNCWNWGWTIFFPHVIVRARIFVRRNWAHTRVRQKWNLMALHCLWFFEKIGISPFFYDLHEKGFRDSRVSPNVNTIVRHHHFYLSQIESSLFYIYFFVLHRKTSFRLSLVYFSFPFLAKNVSDRCVSLSTWRQLPHAPGRNHEKSGGVLS